MNNKRKMKIKIFPWRALDSEIAAMAGAQFCGPEFQGETKI
jgi:hypothetical protein